MSLAAHPLTVVHVVRWSREGHDVGNKLINSLASFHPVTGLTYSYQLFNRDSKYGRFLI